MKEIVHNEFVLISQTVNSSYYCDILQRLRENARRLRPELWRQKDCYITTTHRLTSFFTREFLTESNMTIVPTHPTFLCFPIEGGHFDTIKVIEAESQAVLNTLKEHDFQDASEK
jgi:hypothetical protein